MKKVFPLSVVIAALFSEKSHILKQIFKFEWTCGGHQALKG